MQRKEHSVMFVMALVIGLLAFAGGTITGLSLSRGSLLTMAARVAQITSGAFEKQVSDLPPVTNLNALEVIWEVRDKVLKHFVFPVQDDKKLTYGAIRGMLGSLDDPFTRFLDPREYKEFQTDNSGHFDGIGAVLEGKVDPKSGNQEIVISSILPEGPASKTNLRPGDIVVRVDKTSTDGMTVTQVVNLIRGPRGTKVTLWVARKGSDKALEIPVVRANIEVKVVEYKMLDEKQKIGYVWLRQFNQNAAREMRSALDDLQKQGMKGLVLDLSMDPGGILDVAVEVASMFISDGPIVYIKNRGEEPKPLNAIAGQAIDPRIPIAVLIDGGSASASEILSGALQDTGRATICGQHSFGKAKVQTIIELQDDSALFLTTALYLTPKLRDIGAKDADGNPGVKPDKKFVEPAPDANIKFKEWHDDQVKQTTDVLREKMGLK